MKTKVITFVILFLIGTTSVFAASKTEKFKVYGNCGMCEKTIEKAAKTVSGVSAADWNKETKQIAVTFDDAKTDIHKVHMAIAKAGYDTDMHRADDKTYNALPGCCQYERVPKKAEMK